jgi:hypothetical protein
MFSVRPTRRRPSLLLAAWAIAAVIPAARGAGPGSLTLIDRSVVQDQGSWQVDYRLRSASASGVIVTPTEIRARVEGWVSNSRVASHAVPRWSALVISGQSGPSTSAEVIASGDEAQKCRERAVLSVATGEGPGQLRDPDPTAKPAVRAAAAEPQPPPQPLLSLAPGAVVRVRLRLEHQHVLYGDYDPLLGIRTVELHLGAATFRDVVPLDREQYLAQPNPTWPAPPEDRRDTRYFVSPPDSLHLEAHIPGNQYYRFPERPVRYATKMRLRYWYLIAAGTEGECRARIAQYKDTPTAWKILSEGSHEQCLTTIGRWVKVDRVFRTEPEATTLLLDFRISGADVGEMWIDDVVLEPIAASPGGP